MFDQGDMIERYDPIGRMNAMRDSKPQSGGKNYHKPRLRRHYAPVGADDNGPFCVSVYIKWCDDCERALKAYREACTAPLPAGYSLAATWDYEP